MAVGTSSAGKVMESFPYGGRILRPIVRGNFGGNIEGKEYAIRILSGHIFAREALLSGGPTKNEAGVPSGDKDDFVLPLSTVVLCFGVGKNVRAYGQKRPRRDRMGAQFALH